MGVLTPAVPNCTSPGALRAASTIAARSGHGASALLRDRLLEESDKYTVMICEVCGLLAYHDIKQNKYVCRICGERAVISPVALSYAFKLLLQELMALGVAPRLNISERA